ncbi:hypothetical protein D3C78_1058730 [compost metagenome]
MAIVVKQHSPSLIVLQELGVVLTQMITFVLLPQALCNLSDYTFRSRFLVNFLEHQNT